MSRHRIFKDRLYGQFARIGKALGNPHRLELLELLAQGERPVEDIARESGLPMANASQHLQALRAAGLVETRKQGLFVHYRLADPSVFELCRALRNVAEKRLAEAKKLGFNGAIGPLVRGKKVTGLHGVADVRSALNKFLEKD